MNKLVIGILAHVDAGKTTLSEALLYSSGSIRELGRVDHKTAFLDTFTLERQRGITIFSKQAQLVWEDSEITLLDTPGHVDFSAEMERTLQVLDYAVLVISGTAGIQGHTKTLWKLLQEFKIPTFVFVNKMDMAAEKRTELYAALQQQLDEGCIDFSGSRNKNSFLESIAILEENLLEQYLASGQIADEQLISMVKRRKLFPCYFGSALKLQGITDFLHGLHQYTTCPSRPTEFGAKVYKVSRDPQGSRLVHLKITGGCLKVKDSVSSEDGHWEEKINQIRIYSGSKYQTVKEVSAGMVCAVTGLSLVRPGEGLGREAAGPQPFLVPVLKYQVILPPGCDVHVMLKHLRLLEEEEPQLYVIWEESLQEIHVRLMGEIQTEILKSQIEERFGVSVTFGTGKVLYKETIQEAVVGVGHFEPLRHYAEVHLYLEPLPRGSGLVFAANLSEDNLDGNWQRLILTHLQEKEHQGVLAGFPITDMKITLVAGRAHIKHTEGGDFREACYRAVRQGLRQTESLLLEPVYRFRLEVPADLAGRAMSDIGKAYGEVNPPEILRDTAILKGTAPVACLQNYQAEVQAYTKGLGRLSCTLMGYEPCHNEKEIVAEIGYDPDRDVKNPSGSVFCSHGAGFTVPWDKVEQYMHVDSGYGIEVKPELIQPEPVRRGSQRAQVFDQEEKELQEIFTRTYGSKKEKSKDHARRIVSQSYEGDGAIRPKKKNVPMKEYLLVDGYNIVFAWAELKNLAEQNINGARDKLADILCNYQGYKKCTVILVYDAYQIEGHLEEVVKYNNIYIVYTKEAETADQYIEKTVHLIGKTNLVTVATSDRLEQVIIIGQGGHLLSAEGLRKEVASVNRQIQDICGQEEGGQRNYLFDYAPKELSEYLAKVRMGKEVLE